MPPRTAPKTARKAHAQAGAELDAARLAGALRAARHTSIISIDLSGVIQVFNTGAERMLGYTAAELVGRATPDLFHLASELEAYGRELSERLGHPVRGVDVFVERIRQGGPEVSDTRQWTYVRKDGSHVPVEVTVTGVYSESGELEGFLGVGLDLSERRTLEAELRRAQLSVDSAGDMILWARLDDARVVFANRAACDLLGYSRQELLSMTVMGMNPARSLANWHAHGDVLRDRGRRTLETSLRRKDGSPLAVESSSTYVLHEGVEYSVGLLRDLSQRKSLEAELQQAQVSVDTATDIILWVDAQDRRIAYTNRAASLELGYSQEELLGMPIERLNRRRTPENWQESLLLLQRTGRDFKEGRYQRRDGSSFPTEVRAVLAWHKGRRYVVAIVRDISERKALEAELRQAQVGMENVLDMIFWVGVEDRQLAYANRAACQGLGYSREELLGLPIERLNHARTPENWREGCNELRKKGQGHFEAMYHRKDGTSFLVDARATMVVHEGREYVVATLRDISERKALEAELRRAQVSVDTAGDMISWVDLGTGRIVFVNETACRILGYSREELLAGDVQLVNPWRDKDDWAASLDRLRAVGRITYEARYRRKDGSTLPVETKATLIVHEGAEYAVGIARDLSERKAQELRVQQETRLNQSLAETARSLLGTAPDINAVAELLLERACELTGSRHGYVAFIDQESGGLQPRAMSAMMKSGECTLGALPVTFPISPDGVYPGLWGHSLNTRLGFYTNDPARHASAASLPSGHVPISQLLSVPALAKGRLVGQIALANPGRDYTQADLELVGSLADIFALGAEQVLNQKALLAAKEEAEASSRSKSEFLANMTHEVRTPLNGILGMLQVLDLSGLNAEQAEHVAVARQAAERLNLLLNNVIDCARLDTARISANVQDFPPRDLLSSLRARFEPKARDKGLDFLLEADPQLPELVRTDPQILRQALAHLLDNALKFTHDGHVTLAAAQAPHNRDLLVFRVEDSGIGIPPEKRTQVFEAFVQADASFTRTFGGAGLGLSIASKLIARLGGSLEAQDRPGGGTVMLLTIPVQHGEA